MGYMVGNNVSRLHLRVAVKQNFIPYIRRYTSSNVHSIYSYPLSLIGGNVNGHK